MRVRVAMAGCGWISSYQLAGWRLVPEVELVGVCDLVPDRAQALAVQFGIPWAGQEAARMLEECRPDVLDIAATPASHRDLGLAAIERGVHVLCQKPAAPTLAEAEEMVAAAERRGVVFYVNEMLRFCPWFVKARDLLAWKTIGRPVFARLVSRSAEFLEVGPDQRVVSGFREFLKTACRVIVLEETIHYLDVARFFFGEPLSIYAATERVSSLLRGEDLATVVLRYDGLTALIEDSWSAHGTPRWGLEVEGAEGAIFLSRDKVLELYLGRRGGIEERWDFSGRSWDQQRSEVFAALFQDFLRVVAGQGEAAAQARDNLRTLRLALAAYESAESGAVVRL
jgi:predicted dehydrogenase